MKPLAKKLILGTANFGMAYGLKNNFSQIQRSNVSELLETCVELGVYKLDTAIDYGKADKIIGSQKIQHFQITTKIQIKDLKVLPRSIKKIEKHFENLRVSKVKSILVHDADTASTEDLYRAFEILNYLRDQKYCDTFGISIYDPNVLETLHDDYKVDLIQCPFNVLDNRIGKYYYRNLNDMESTKIQVRSLFLQGLFFIPSNSLPNYFNKWKHIFEEIKRICEYNKISIYDFLLREAVHSDFIDEIVIGFDNKTQLQSLFMCNFDTKYSELIDLSDFKNNLNLCDPRLWER